MAETDKIREHVQRLQTFRTDRGVWESQWEEVAERLIPAHKSSFFSRGMTSAFTPGRKNTEVMFDATAALALQRFTSVIESLSTPQGQTWHRLVPAEDSLRKNREVRLFLDELNSIVFRQRYRPQANFIGQAQKTYTGYGAYGNGLLFIDGPEDREGLRYKNLHLGETYLAENHEGVVDTMYRSFFMKPRQIIQKYGEENVPESVKKLNKDPGQREKDFEVLHVVIPRADRDPGRRDSKGLPWASLHIFVQENEMLRESGYASFPLAITRYTQFTGEVYGRGPAQLVLPAIKVLNEEKKTVLKQGHRTVDPVLLAHDDGIVGTFSLRPGAMNPGGVNAQGRPLVHPLPVGNVMVGKELMDDERQVINDAFLITLFQILIDTPQMTATEVLERAREKGMLVAPTVGRQQAEFLGPMIEREIDVLTSQGMLPPVPAALLEAGGGYRVEYDSPLSRMMRAEEASGFMRSLTATLDIVKITQDPSPLDWFNFDVAVPAIQDISGAPVAWTSTLEEVEEKRAARAEAQQTQQMLDAAPALAGAAKTVGDLTE